MTAASAAGVPQHPVDALAARYWESFLALHPEIATEVGDDRYDDRLTDPSPEGRAAFRDLNARTLAELEAMTGPAPQGEAAVTGDVLRFMCAVSIELEDSGWPYLESIGQQDGPQALLPLVAQMQPFGTQERLDRWEARLAAYPAHVTAHIERIREALDRGITPPRIVAERVVEQLERLIAQGAEDSPLVTRAGAEGSAREHLVAAVERDVLPTNERLLAAVRDVLPLSREEPGLSNVPGGEAMYAARMHSWTTLPSDPGQLHRRGIDELESIEAERRAIAEAAGLGPDTRAFRRSLAALPGNAPTSVDELLDRMREDVTRALDAAPGWFGRLPKTPCLIEALDRTMEADALGYYISPTTDGRRPGVFYMNTSELSKRLFTRFATVTYHETIPGHHFQLAIEAERDDLVPFRRQGANHVAGAFVEGWGLYSERLADEMGLFRDPGERFGMLDAQAWRAARLVIDTGLHAFGWDRERAIDLFQEATGFELADAAIEVDRYIAIPGQALAYKVGQGEIERLRREAREEAGAGFDLRHFHDEILGHGSLPLEVLARHLPGWLNA